MIVTLLLVGVTVMTAQQNMRVPDSFKQMQIEKIGVQEGTGTTKGVSTMPKTKMAGQLIGNMWNAYNSLNRSSNQIGWDPYSKTLCAILRGDRTSHTVAGELVLGTSTDMGQTWTLSNTINTGLGNDVGELTARHPNIMLMNPTKTTDMSGLKLAATWGNLYSTAPRGFYEIPYLSGSFSGNYTKKKLNVSPPDLTSPTRMTLVPQTNKMFAMTEGIDPTTGSATGEYFLLTSDDLGVTWNMDKTHPIITLPLQDGYTIYGDPTIDTSPDGQTVAIGFVGILTDDQGSFRFVDNRIGYMVSTDGGVTFGDPQLISIPEITYLNVNFDADNGFFYPNLSMVIDGQSKPHFLTTITSDDFFYLDSTYVGEITYNGSNWEFFGLYWINNPWVKRFVSPGTAGQAQTQFNIWNEHEWAKSIDGNKIWAKWIDPDSNFVTTPAGHQYQLARDTIHNVYVTAKDIGSTGDSNRGWVGIYNVTQTPTIDEKFTKIAPFVGDDNTLHMIYTIFAEAEYEPGKPIPDADDQNEAMLYYISGVSIEAPLAADNAPVADGFNLSQNFPNPFNPTTTISFNLPVSGMTKLTVYNLLGKEVATVFNGFLNAGTHSMNFNAAGLTSGTYLYRLEAGSHNAARTMTLLK
jgi:hypothetical protein